MGIRINEMVFGTCVDGSTTIDFYERSEHFFLFKHRKSENDKFMFCGAVINSILMCLIEIACNSLKAEPFVDTKIQ